MTEQNAQVQAGDDGAGANEGANAGQDANQDANEKTILNDGQNAAEQGADGAQDGAQAQGEGGEGEGAVKDWRDQVAAGDEKFRKQLDRIVDLSALGKKLRSLESKFSSGEYKRQLGEGATDEEVKAWRKENGIPEEAKGYLDKMELPDGMVLGEADKPVAESFAEAAQAMNLPPEAFNGVIGWYYAQQDAIREQREESDAQRKQESEDELRGVWEGADYRRNLNSIQNMMATWPEGLADRILAGRTPDGRKIGDDPAFIQAMAHLAGELNPAATLVPHSGADQAKGVEDRIAEIKGWMGASKGSDNWKKYWKDDAVQNEYRELLTAQEKLKARAA